jgi:predicted DCC family thiol-disulfide oxidoreductase YuxK
MPNWKLLFDEDCALCGKFAGAIARFDKKNEIEIISYQEHYQADSSIPLDKLSRDIHLIGKDGECLRGGEAIEKLISIIPQSRPIRWMVERKVIKKTATPLYRLMKKFRTGCLNCGD